MKKKKAHLLKADELAGLKAIRVRKTVSTTDYPLVSGILTRMNPNLDICETCVDTLAAEVKNLIAYAEKQLGHSILDYKVEGEEDADVETKEVRILREWQGQPAWITANVPADTPENASIEITKDMIVKIENLEAKGSEGGTETEDTGTEGSKKSKPEEETPEVTEKIVLDHEGIAGLTNENLIAYVKQETGIELSADADRSTLLADADDLLDEKQKQAAETKKEDKIELPKNGFTGLKNEEVYKYVKQETGIDLKAGLKRPELLKAASQCMKDHAKGDK